MAYLRPLIPQTWVLLFLLQALMCLSNLELSYLYRCQYVGLQGRWFRFTAEIATYRASFISLGDMFVILLRFPLTCKIIGKGSVEINKNNYNDRMIDRIIDRIIDRMKYQLSGKVLLVRDSSLLELIPNPLQNKWNIFQFRIQLHFSEEE